jgi:hypothetical protein
MPERRPTLILPRKVGGDEFSATAPSPSRLTGEGWGGGVWAHSVDLEYRA